MELEKKEGRERQNMESMPFICQGEAVDNLNVLDTLRREGMTKFYHSPQIRQVYAFGTFAVTGGA